MGIQESAMQAVDIHVQSVKEFLLSAFPLDKKELRPQDLFWSDIQGLVEEKLLPVKDENLLVRAINELIKEDRFRVSVRKSEFLVLQRVS